jgi:hypothetical protein
MLNKEEKIMSKNPFHLLQRLKTLKILNIQLNNSNKISLNFVYLKALNIPKELNINNFIF